MTDEQRRVLMRLYAGPEEGLYPSGVSDGKSMKMTGRTRRELESLSAEGLVRSSDDGRWTLTAAGRSRAQAQAAHDDWRKGKAT